MRPDAKIVSDIACRGESRRAAGCTAVCAAVWRSIPADRFDLRLTLESGQFFRYYEQDYGRTPVGKCSGPQEQGVFREYLLLTQGRALRVRQEGARLHYCGADASFVRHLFQLTPEYDDQVARLRKDPVLRKIVDSYPGLRLMRQDLHETIIGFICSSQSNIPKIRMNLHLLAESCGERAGGYAFLPAPGKQLELASVTAAKTGYRARFIVATNSALSAALLDEIAQADYARSHALLCGLSGIGPKIADCVCLFSLGHGEAFPVDVHIIRAMRALFPQLRSDEVGIKRFAQERWKNDAGLAQQFIYQWARDNLVNGAKRKARPDVSTGKRLRAAMPLRSASPSRSASSLRSVS
jgi:N-glycosylase/DNA lyase